MTKTSCKILKSILLFIMIIGSYQGLIFSETNKNSSRSETINNLDDFAQDLATSTTNWATTEILSNSSIVDSYIPAVASDGAGNIHVTWYDWTNNYSVLYKFKNATTGAWAVTELVSTETIDDSYRPTIAVDNVGNVHIAWEDKTDYNGSGTDTDIFYKFKNATTGIWTNTEVVSTESTGGGGSWCPAIAIDGIGNIHVTWYDYTYLGPGAGPDIFYKFKNVTTMAWTTTEEISNENYGISLQPVIVADGIGNVHIAWFNGSGGDMGDVYYIFKNASTGLWTTVEEVSAESTNDSSLPTIALDGVGNIHLAWEDYTNYSGSGTDADIFYKFKNATTGTWTNTEVVSTESTGGSRAPAIAIDNLGNIHVGWMDNMFYDGHFGANIFYKLKNNFTKTWTKTEVVTTEGPDASVNPTITVNGDRNIHIVWMDNLNYSGAGTDWDIFYKYYEMDLTPPSLTDIQVSSDPLFLNGTQTITCNVSDPSGIFSITAYIEHPDEIIIATMVLYDDGLNGDGNFNDGIYGNIWDSNGVALGTYFVDILALDNSSFQNKELINNGVSFIIEEGPPIITINSPTPSAVFGNDAPSYNVSIPGLYHSMWYTLDDGVTNITTSGLIGIINQTEWDKEGDGNVTITFYANNTFGKIGFNSVKVIVDKNIPIIDINSPTTNQLFENNIPSPTFNIWINETNLVEMWYTLNSESFKYFFLTNSSINQNAWNTLSDGTVTIRFYANDSLGNIGFAEVTIGKDISAPIITINNPQNGDINGATAPNFNISIIEPFLAKTWYSLNGGNNITFMGLTGTINQALWDALSEGNVIIRFYANDTLGRISFTEVAVVRIISQSNLPGIPGYNILLIIGIVSTITVIIIKKRLNHIG